MAGVAHTGRLGDCAGTHRALGYQTKIEKVPQLFICYGFGVLFGNGSGTDNLLLVGLRGQQYQPTEGMRVSLLDIYQQCVATVLNSEPERPDECSQILIQLLSQDFFCLLKGRNIWEEKDLGRQTQKCMIFCYDS